MRNMVLGCLVDLCENDKALPCVIQWRSSRNLEFTAAHLMVQIWREEDTSFGVYPADGYIVPDTEAPLMPEGWAPCGGGISAVDEVSASQRSKVYALLSRTGWEVYSGLSATDKVTLEVIRAYLTLKRGEIWQEIAVELSNDGVVPTEADQDFLDLALWSNQDAIAALRNTQADIQMAAEDKNLDELEEAFTEVERNNRAAAVARERKMTMLERTTSHQKLKEARQRQLDTISKSRKFCKAAPLDAEDHRSEIAADESLATTSFPRHIALTGLLQPGCDGRELPASDTRGVLDGLSTLVLDEPSP